MGSALSPLECGARGPYNTPPMSARLRLLFARHPLLRDALLWAVPAIILGAVLRAALLHSLPYAYWGSDSKSYYSFAQKLFAHGGISLDAKRRFLYPVLMAVVSLLPGATLKWIAFWQHALGLATLVPLAYVVRKSLAHWRLWIVPVTAAYAAMPMIVWYEHELLGETVFFAALTWAFAGWLAWAGEPRLARARRLFWWFFVPLALFLLTKPSGRFVLPGVCVGLAFLVLERWRAKRPPPLDWLRWAALGVLLVGTTLFVGSKKQGAWLFYVACFPLTQVDTPLHAGYKEEIRGMVEPLHRDLATYYLHDDEPFAFLEAPNHIATTPKWRALDDAARSPLYMALGIEGIKAEPLQFLFLGWQRIVSSANPSQFRLVRFDPKLSPLRFQDDFEDAQTALTAGRSTPIPMLFGLPKHGPLPPWEEIQHRLSPAPDGWGSRLVQRWTTAYNRVSDLVHMPESRDKKQREIWKARPTPLGIWLVAGALLAVALPAYRRTLGVWTIIAVGYLFGMFLVGQTNPRYFGPAWPVLVVLLAVPADALVRLATRRKPEPAA